MPNLEDSKSEAFLELISDKYANEQLALLDYLIEEWGRNGKRLTDLAHNLEWSWHGLKEIEIAAVFHDMEILAAIHDKESKENFEGFKR